MKREISSSVRTPAIDQRFRVGELVDVYCDHTRSGERVRDWLQGVVVQADRKMLAIQFVDVIAHIAWSLHEDGQHEAYRILAPHMKCRQLFFGQAVPP